MALVGKNGRLTFDFPFDNPGSHCFYCGEKLAGDYFVMWQGALPTSNRNQPEIVTEIWLHVDCAKRLSDHLAKDCHQYRTGQWAI